MSHVIVAIDGPAASGKSSVALHLARRLGYIYVNTGAMYRAVTWLVLRENADPNDSEAVLNVIERSNLKFGLDGHESMILVDDADPTPHLSEPGVNQSVSTIASITAVRSLLVAHQREYALENDIVMEGRDIGSVVFPDTPYKFYIDASLDVRARRRELQGFSDEIRARDRRDSSRKASPLVIAEDAHVIDSSNLTIDGVVGEIIGRLKLKGLPLPAHI